MLIDLVVRVKEIIGYCPVYKVGDTFVLEGGYKINPKRSCTICMHSLSAIMPYHVALSHGVDPKEIGLAREGDKAYVQCLDPCKYTGGGTVIFEIEIKSL